MCTSIFPLIFSLLFVATASYAEDSASWQADYRLMLEAEREKAGLDQRESIIGGAAAVVIGLYGYYNTSPDPLVKLLYAATQTGGVLAIGQGIKDHYAPRLSLDLDRLIETHADSGQIPSDELKAALVRNKKLDEQGATQTNAATATILSVLYLYNGIRESEKTLQSVYYFLGFNFAVGGAYGFYKARRQEKGDIDITILPHPGISYHF